MEIFFTLLIKLIPLYLILLVGYLGGKYLHIQKESIATLLIDIIVPVIVFTGAVKTEVNISTISLPILFFVVCLIVSLITYALGGFFWKDATRNILSFIAGSGNTGYFGLPVAIALFGNTIIGIVAAAILGTNLYATSIGFYIAAKGHHTVKESISKILKLPILYAFILGIVVNIAGIKLGNIYFDTANSFNGAYIVLGMMLVGLGLSDSKTYKIDFRFIGISFIAKFLLWPLVVIAILFLDEVTFKIYNPHLYKIILLMTIVPLAANVVSYATVLKSHPEKVAMAVLLSTLFALLYIPLVAFFFFK
ncbi:MAG TPA: AEC family transporter [Candidatus Sulfotelmatobacter sp.]|jgi:predicted permease|nr:AEC family transporter [Candidatus Sulfotelmatobacter sp.]